jgi:acyl carrier protein
VKKMLAQEIELPVESLMPGTRLDSLGIDSLDVLKLAVLFERRFNVTMTTDELVAIKTVDDVVASLHQKVGT